MFSYYYYNVDYLGWQIFGGLVDLQVPHVNRVDYQLIDISEDGFVSLPSYEGLMFLLIR